MEEEETVWVERVIRRVFGGCDLRSGDGASIRERQPRPSTFYDIPSVNPSQSDKKTGQGYDGRLMKKV